MWTEYLMEYRTAITEMRNRENRLSIDETKEWAKEQGIKAVSAHYKRMHPEMLQVEIDAFSDLISKMRTL